jgi:hypothetical protein
VSPAIGRQFIIAGSVLQMFPNLAQVGAFLTQLGEGIEVGKATVGPIRIGDEAITATVGPWK